MMIAQLSVLLLLSAWLGDYSKYFYTFMNFLSAVLIIYEINREEEPGFKLTWVMLIAIIPIFGTLLYIFLHYNRASKKIAVHSDEIRGRTLKYTKQETDVLQKFSETYQEDIGISKYIYDYSGFPVYKNSSAEYFSLGDQMFIDLKDELRKAEKFIFIEMFIINLNGRMWPEILEILKEKAKEGVEVRLMYDGMGCMSLLPNDYDDTIRKFGINCRVFAPIVPFFSTYQNNRDHRKIILIDGKTVYTGGVNFADEYINERERFGHWKDNAIKITGDAVSGYSSMFLQMWNTSINKVKEDNYDKYINSVSDGDFKEGDGYIIPFADSPLKKDRFGETMYINNLNLAKDYVHIMTPYLVLGTNMMQALKFAAKRGVDVKIILPHIPDKPYAFWLAGTYYRELLGAGVKIYEYTPGFVHSKMSISDDKRAIIGTINHDYRSLYLHYECAAYLVDVPQIKDMESDFVHTLSLCEEVTEDTIKNRSLVTRILGRVIRLIAPLL